MRIIDARWTKHVNYLLIECECGNRWWHRADRRKVVCHKCLSMEDLLDLKANKDVNMKGIFDKDMGQKDSDKE